MEDVDADTETVGGSSHLKGSGFLNTRVTPRAIQEKNFRTGFGRFASVLRVGTGDADGVGVILGVETAS